MSREILFRGKRIDNGKWVEGDLSRCVVVGETHIRRIEENLSTTTHKINPETVCQYTGLSDKNGRKIFDGDIVKIPYEHMEDNICKVIFRRGMFLGETVDGCEDSIMVRGVKVIGNLWDNPELLNQ